MLELDAITSVSERPSPVGGLAKRCKQVWTLSKGNALQPAEAINHYKYLAEDFDRLENETYSPMTDLGMLWASRQDNPTHRLEETTQARSNFIIRALFDSMHPELLPEQEHGRHSNKLRKERMIARNVALMIQTFGYGIVPLMSNSSWRQWYIYRILPRLAH